MREETAKQVLVPSYKDTNPINNNNLTLTTSSKPNYVPKAPPPNTITLGIKAPTYEFWGDTHIQILTRFSPNNFFAAHNLSTFPSFLCY